MDFSTRSGELELLDQPGIPFEDIQQNLKELEFINRYLGGHAISTAAVAHLSGNLDDLHICEVGCGGGDNLSAIERWAKKHKRHFKFTGIDYNPECIAYAKQQHAVSPNYTWLISDYRNIEFGKDPPDIVFSSLFCHHLSNAQLSELAEWKRRNSRIGFFVNDLHRHPLAYYSIRALTALFSRSYLVKNDAALSVLRGFKKAELLTIFGSAPSLSISWRWAFRWLVIEKHERSTAI